MGFRVWALGLFRVQGLEFRVVGLGFGFPQARYAETINPNPALKGLVGSK